MIYVELVSKVILSIAVCCGSYGLYRIAKEIKGFSDLLTVYFMHKHDEQTKEPSFTDFLKANEEIDERLQNAIRDGVVSMEENERFLDEMA